MGGTRPGAPGLIPAAKLGLDEAVTIRVLGAATAARLAELNPERGVRFLASARR